MDLYSSNLCVSESLKEQYLSNYPFPHIIIDNFMNEEFIEKVEKELRGLQENIWYSKRDPLSLGSEVQKKKISIADCSNLGENTKKAIEFFSSKEFTNFLEEMTGITDLITDPSLIGGGVHRTDHGGKLSIHADFNLHPSTGYHRRLNALLYLNPNYKDEYQGKLELWDKSMKSCVKQISPIFNRLTVFTITDDAYHGHPDPWLAPSDKFRLSLAFYYYTKDRPEKEKAPFHWADWKYRPMKGW